MPTERRHRTVSERDSYTNVQQHKRSRSSRSQDGKMSERQCTSLIPSATDSKLSSPTTTPWKGWQTAPAKPTLRSLKENSEFPPLNNDLDAWYTPQPIKNWADYMDEEEEAALQENIKPKTNVGNKKQRNFKRKLCLSESGGKSSPHDKQKKPILTDEHKLGQRQKQIDYGKNTVSYGRYVAEIPRQCRDTKHPRTPDKFQICSTRSWDGQVKCWRRKLHDWDLPTEGKVNPFSLMSGNMAGIELQFDQLSSLGSASSTSSSQEFFAELDIDKCLLEDGLPL